MPKCLILFVGLLYLVVGVKLGIQGKTWLSLVFVSYAVSNLGLAMSV